MRRKLSPPLVLFGLAAALLPLPEAHAQGSGVHLSASAGIGGRYRPGGWIPITIGVIHPGPETVHGQLQISQTDANGASNGAIFARPVDIAPGTTGQTVQIDERGLDPGSQDVAVTLVDGAARGDGAQRAQITSQAADARNAFTGTPISQNDLLLVGLSADTTAITRLSGQQWGLMHTAGGVTRVQQLSASNPRAYPLQGVPSVEAAAASPADLPDRAAGYDGVDAVLLRADAPLDALSEAQTDALKAWVTAGGHLIVGGGTRIGPYADPFYAGLLPAGIPSASAAGLALTPKPLPGVRVLMADRGRPTVVTGPYGAGRVTVLATDAGMGTALWKTILESEPSSLLGVAVAQETEDRYFYNGGSGQLSDSVLRAPSLDAPGAGVVGLFLLGYLLILVPLNYLILKRLDKKEWSWATIPGLVAVFAAVTYGVGDAAKGNSVFVNRAEIIETTAGRSEAGVYAAVGLFSPRRTSYDLTLADPEALASDPLIPRQRFYYGPSQTDMMPSGQAHFVQGPSEAAVQDADVNMWAMRAFDVQTVTDLGGAITAHLQHNTQTGEVTGTVVNGTTHALTGCRLYLNGSWQPLPDLPSGGSAAVIGIFPLPAANTVPQGWNTGAAWGGASPTASVHQRMQVALAGFVGGLGSGGSSPYAYGYGNGEPPAVFQPGPNEAILTGYCDDLTLGGPSVRVDGHPVTQNILSCVVVHIPL